MGYSEKHGQHGKMHRQNWSRQSLREYRDYIIKRFKFLLFFENSWEKLQNQGLFIILLI